MTVGAPRNDRGAKPEKLWSHPFSLSSGAPVTRDRALNLEPAALPSVPYPPPGQPSRRRLKLGGHSILSPELPLPMPYAISRPSTRPTTPTVAYTIVGSFTAYGRSVSQIQYVTDRFVITRVERGTFIYLRDRDERFLAEVAANRLTPLEPGIQRIQADKLRSVVGEIAIQVDEEEIESGGFTCRRYRFNSSSARIVIAGETLATRLPALAGSALQAERAHDSRSQPFSLPLEPDQLVVRSSIRTVASQFDQNQSYRLESIEDRIEDFDRLERLAQMRVSA